jgi:hypothetical protein
MKQIAKIIEDTQNQKRAKNISREFQLFGVYLAESLDDTKHYSLYIKLAKTYDRGMLEEALSFVKGSTTVKSKGRLFMWKLKQLKTEQKITLTTVKKSIPEVVQEL